MKPSTHDLIAYLEQNELKYAQRSDDEDIVILGFTTQRASLSLMFICEKRSVQLLCRLPSLMATQIPPPMATSNSPT